jgi:hypothetical protein
MVQPQGYISRAPRPLHSISIHSPHPHSPLAATAASETLAAHLDAQFAVSVQPSALFSHEVTCRAALYLPVLPVF